MSKPARKTEEKKVLLPTDKAFIGAAALFAAPMRSRKECLTLNAHEKHAIKKISAIFEDCNDDEMAITLMVFVYDLGKRISEKEG